VSGFRRPVSPTEWFYLAAQRTMPPFAIRLVVEGQGRVDPDALARAVAIASAACPGARLVRRGRTWVDTGEPPKIVTTSGKLWPQDGPETTTSGKLCGSCDLVVGADGIMFRAFHGVMDGRGVLAWATDVFRALRSETPLGAASPITDYELVDRLGAVGRRPRTALGWRSPLAAADPAPVLRDLGVMAAETPSGAAITPRSTGLGAGQGTGRARRTIDGNHPGLVAKLAAAIAAATGRRSRFLVPVDLRRHDPHLRSTANLTLPVFLDTDAGEPWDELHERLLCALAERRELTGGAAERIAYRLPLGLLAPALRAAAPKNLCSAILSHLGRVDLADFTAPRFQPSTVYSVPVHAPLTRLSIVATEPPGRTELAIAHNGPAQAAEALFDTIEAALAPHRHWAGNNTARPVGTQTITGLFARRVAAHPDALALTGPQGDVTYAELDRRADVVAQALRDRGVGRGAVVGLLADRTVDAVAGLCGILKAGAAYLPLDPQHPDGRIEHLLHDAKAPVCLVGRRHASRVRENALILDDLPASGAPAAEDTTTPGDLAYVIYTSGSTGQPKGVQIEHRNLVNYITWATELYRVDAGTRFALFTSLAFDLTGTAILLPLLAGGSIALIPDEVTHGSLRDMLEHSGATALKLTPAHLDLIGRLGLAPTGFRLLVVGGEQLRGTVAARALRAFGAECRIVNEYGPTEATIGCVVHVFDPTRDADAPAVPIGLPVANTSVFLLDAQRRFVAPGEVGEVYLGGAQLARGYLGRADLDRERFTRLADGTRVYRTGDLAKLTGGVLEYLGRADDQIKIRGHRIEPGEIEAALEAYPGIVRAVVVARARDARTDRALCAYVLGTAGLSEVDVREHLAARLPHYMVPAAIVAVDELPQTTNGKIDVRALPDPFARAGRPTAGPRARDDVEERVAKIWGRILEIDPDPIHTDSDFHSLGGDSLSMVEMLAALTEEFASDGLATAVIRNPTLGAVCAVVRDGGR
jgi:acyl carrier protein